MNSSIIHVYVGLDFGTTYSKAAVARYPGVKPAVAITPSTLVRNTVSNDVEFVHSRPRPIEHAKAMRYLKLALMEPEGHHDERSDPNLLQFIQGELRTNAASGTPGTSHASMFLKGLWDMAIRKLPNENCLLNVAITYPSCWDTQELGRLQKAVNEAEIPRQATTIQYVPEQIAAAFGVGDADMPTLQDGDSIIVVDCGGATIDSALCKLKPCPVRNVVPGDCVHGESSLYGTKAMEIAFETLISNKLSRATLPTFIDPEMVKSSARGDWNRSKLPGVNLLSLPLFQGMIFKAPEGSFRFGINQDDVLSIFQEPVDRVVDIVKRFRESARGHNTKPKALFLTGGLFGIASIAAKIEKELKSDTFDVIVTPRDSLQKVVARGAAAWLRGN
ncbi:hypothetical protein BKA56DRAFT_664654 [Ilyonectria sp. MPI-CAGE-AT-0026]|nr:hypothetical protein BKA56DRAFT_664654 [Ilyonectria sp. MPI-CAGE-AT-0026]